MAYFVISAISENFCQPLMIIVVFLIEQISIMLVNVWKLLVYSSIKQYISRNLYWQGGGVQHLFKALLEISPIRLLITRSVTGWYHVPVAAVVSRETWVVQLTRPPPTKPTALDLQ